MFPSPGLKASWLWFQLCLLASNAFAFESRPSRLFVRNDCPTQTVSSGDGCASLARKCGISDRDFSRFNPSSNLCSALQIGQLVCCGSGNLPDLSPKANLDGTCRTQTVSSGDGCGTMVTKCQITAQQFTQYNPDSKLCSILAAGQRVCCSPGTLPDIRPKSNLDGSCSSYVVQTDDTCSAIAAAHGLALTDIDKFNDKTTWGWSGCDQLGAQQTICLSQGTPPMPQPLSNAVCGPLVPGSKPPSAGSSLADLNPCPLNACCTHWGQCGVTPDYCRPATGPRRNPGTAPSHQNACISNCGTDITRNDTGPKSVITVGYYESWSQTRPCLNMRVSSIDTDKYTHIHWAFATIDDNFDVVINDTSNQWIDFTKIQGTKRIISFGGWGFSTEPATYDKLRQAMRPAHVNTFASNIANFVSKNNLDGVDVDWEYPGAPDIPGIPPGLATDGPNYLAFLRTLRYILPQDKSMSTAVPASYWYLKQFSIAEMSEVLDYLVYMTYDLHGQWDYNNKWSQDGCSSGSCLRSHVNLTETNFALAMITKAGVPSNKVVVGLSSYGRSFSMSDPNCAGPDCTFEGPDSTAIAGECTGTPGYMGNGELEALQDNDIVKSYYDTDSNSDIMIYYQNQWISYMTDTTKASRTGYYKSLNFAGTVDWAIDLQTFSISDDDDDEEEEDLPPTDPLPDCDANFGTVEELDAAAGTIPDNCKAVYVLQTLHTVLDDAVKKYNDLMNGGYDAKFKTYASSVADSAGKSVQNFMDQHGNDYFTCVVTEAALCCSACKDQTTSGGNPCAHCFTDGDCFKLTGPPRGGVRAVPVSPRFASHSVNVTSSDDTSSSVADVDRSLSKRDTKLITRGVQVPEPCPPDYSQRGYGPSTYYEQSVSWTLAGEKSDAFYAGLLENTGIPKSKIKFGTFARVHNCEPWVHEGNGNKCWDDGYDFNYPMPNGYDSGDVSNPKAVVQKALGSSNNLQQQISSALNQVRFDAYYADEWELIDAVSVPIFVIANAIEYMGQVEEVADKIDEEKKKALILAFIGAILFFIPIAGEVLGSVVEIGDMAAILTLVSAAGDVATGVYSIVDDPTNPLLGIMQIILAPLALANVGQVAKAASIRRGMSDDDILKLGGKLATRMSTIKKVAAACRR